MQRPPLGIAAGMIKLSSHAGPGLVEIVDHVTYGSYTWDPREGNPEPVYYYDEATGTSYNAVNLRNSGLVHFVQVTLPDLRKLKEKHPDFRIRVSLAPTSRGELRLMTDYLTSSGAYKHIDELEVNASCPNHRTEGKLHDVLAHDPVALGELMYEGISYVGKKAIKIAPEMSEGSLVWAVKHALTYGYTAIVSGNTRRVSSVVGGVKRLSADFCGLAGAPLLEGGIAQVAILKMLIADAGISDTFEIIGCGGAMDVHMVKRYLAAGANHVQVATYYMQFGERGVRDLAAELL